MMRKKEKMRRYEFFSWKLEATYNWLGSKMPVIKFKESTKSGLQKNF